MPTSPTTCSECHEAPVMPSQYHVTMCVACAIEAGPEPKERDIGMRYSQAVLDHAFSAVQKPGDWKAPIDKLLSEQEIEALGGLEVICEAVAHFTATVASTFEQVYEGEACVQIRAQGYRMGPAGP